MKARLLFILSIAVLLAGCGNRDIRSRLDMAESYMQTRPDSALAIIRSIDTTSLGTQSLKARYALLHAIALDKNWIDTTDVGVVMPAIIWYDHHKPLTNRAKPWYYLGRIQYNGHHYDEAILSFTRAREYATSLGDNRFKALVCQAIADTYNNSYLFEEALMYSQEAYNYCLAAGDTLLANAVLYNIARQHNNLQDYQAADSLYLRILTSNKINQNSLPSILADYALLNVTYHQNYSEAFDLFTKARSINPSLPGIQYWGAYAYCLFKTNHARQSEAVFNQLEELGLQDNYIYVFWKSKIKEQEKDFESAYSLLENSSLKQTEGLRIILRQSTVKAQRDFYSLQNEMLTKETLLRRWVNYLLVVSILAFAFIIFLVVRRLQERVKQNNMELMKTVQELVEQNQNYELAVNDLSSKLTEASLRQAGLRQEFFHLSQDSFKRLSDLCNIYYKTEGRSSQDNSVCAEVRGLLKSLGIGEKQSSMLEHKINEQFDRIMAHLRTEHPNHRELFFQTACYLFAGFKIRTIALLLHMSEQDVYQTKWRLKKEVESIHTPHQIDFLTLLDGSSQ